MFKCGICGEFGMRHALTYRNSGRNPGGCEDDSSMLCMRESPGGRTLVRDDEASRPPRDAREPRLLSGLRGRGVWSAVPQGKGARSGTHGGCTRRLDLHDRFLPEALVLRCTTEQRLCRFQYASYADTPRSTRAPCKERHALKQFTPNDNSGFGADGAAQPRPRATPLESRNPWISAMKAQCDRTTSENPSLRPAISVRSL